MVLAHRPGSFKSAKNKCVSATRGLVVLGRRSGALLKRSGNFLKGRSALLKSCLALSGVLWGLWQVRPIFSVEPLGFLDNHDPFSARFTVQNKSQYAIDEVTLQCGIFDVQGLLPMAGFSISGPTLERLGSNKEETLRCHVGPAQDWRVLRLDLRVVYALPFGLHGCQAFPMNGEPGPDGTYLWEHTESLNHDGCGSRSVFRRLFDLDSIKDAIWQPPVRLIWDSTSHQIREEPMKP